MLKSEPMCQPMWRVQCQGGDTTNHNYAANDYNDNDDDYYHYYNDYNNDRGS